MKILSPENLLIFLKDLSADFDLRLPVLLSDGSRSIGSFDEGAISLMGGALSAKPTSLFFPQEGLMFCNQGDNFTPPPLPAKPLFVVGFTPRDLLCLAFIDRFFATGLTDDLYFRQRDGAIICAVSGYCGRDGALIPPSDKEGDIEFIFDRTNWLILAYSVRGREIVSAILTEAPPDALAGIIDAVSQFDRSDELLLQQGSRLLADGLVPDSFWSEIADRCILCTGCNLVCPTCTCFGVQDWRYVDKMERSRIWDSCQLEGFMREAGGHNPMPTEGERTRRRIHHKLAADKTRWGEISCFLCGRCDAVCPTGIGIVSVVREMVARFAPIITLV